MDESAEKYCKDCDTTKALDDFYKSTYKKTGKVKYSSICKSCKCARYADYGKKYYEDHKKERVAYSQKYYAENRESVVLKAREKKRNQIEELDDNYIVPYLARKTGTTLAVVREETELVEFTKTNIKLKRVLRNHGKIN